MEKTKKNIEKALNTAKPEAERLKNKTATMKDWLVILTLVDLFEKENNN